MSNDPRGRTFDATGFGISHLADGGESGNENGTFFRLAADASAKVVMAFVRA